MRFGRESIISGRWVLPMILALVLGLIFACGEKMKLPTEIPPTGNLGDTLYLMLNPPWDADHGYNFSQPTCIYFGQDTYLYVCDTGNNRILQLDAAGTIQGQFPINHPISVSQDELMRLLVVTGEKKVYKIDLGPGGDRTAHIAFDYDIPQRNVPDSAQYFFKLRSMIAPDDRFVSITDLPTNDKFYLVAISSAERNNGRIMWFRGFSENAEYTDSIFDPVVATDSLFHIPWASQADTFINPIIITGNGVTTTNHPNSIYTYQLGGSTHLVVCQDSGSYPVHDFYLMRQVWDQHWIFSYSQLPGESDLLKLGTFDLPKSATVDPQGNLYVVDAGPSATCSGYKFSKTGLLLNTLCEADSGNSFFEAPSGITYDIYGDRRTVFVADTGNNRILRFKLSIDLEP